MYVAEGSKRKFCSWSAVGTRFQRKGFIWAGEVSPHFVQGVNVYFLSVCECAHTHTLHVGYSDVGLGVGTRHLESPEEIQVCCNDTYTYTVVYKIHSYT